MDKLVSTVETLMDLCKKTAVLGTMAKELASALHEVIRILKKNKKKSPTDEKSSILQIDIQLQGLLRWIDFSYDPDATKEENSTFFAYLNMQLCDLATKQMPLLEDKKLGEEALRLYVVGACIHLAFLLILRENYDSPSIYRRSLKKYANAYTKHCEDVLDWQVSERLSHITLVTEQKSFATSTKFMFTDDLTDYNGYAKTKASAEKNRSDYVKQQESELRKSSVFSEEIAKLWKFLALESLATTDSQKQKKRNWDSNERRSSKRKRNDSMK